MRNEYVREEAKEVKVAHKVDVAVLGGGTAGAIAGIAAARSGAKTVIVERFGCLGGTMTTGRMASMGNRFYDIRGRQLLGGLPREVMERLVKIQGTQFANIEDTLKGKLGKPITVPFQPELMSIVLLEMAEEAGVKIMFQTHSSHLLGQAPNPQGFVVVNKSGPQAILADVMIDASGDADLAAAAGAPCIKNLQTSWGLLMRLGNVKFDKVIDMVSKLKPWEPWPEFTPWFANIVGKKPEELKADWYWNHILDPVKFGHAPMKNHEDIAYSPEKLRWIIDRWEKEGIFYNIEFGIIRHLLREAVDNGDLFLIKKVEGFGEIRLNWDGFAGGAWGPGVSLVNACHVMGGFDGTNGNHVSRAEIEARKGCFEIANFFKKYVPGYEDSYIIDMGQQTIPRHARMIQGLYEMKHEDIVKRRSFDDAVYLFHGLAMPGEPTGVPFRILVPKNVDNILVVGKCASGAIYVRSEPSCMAMGQAAGTAASLMVKEGTANHRLDISRLRECLRNDGVILSM